MVAGLFDQYADHFDEHLVQKLGYKTPQLLL
jgi:predicted TPR repeat methyltransferase